MREIIYVQERFSTLKDHIPELYLWALRLQVEVQQAFVKVYQGQSIQQEVAQMQFSTIPQTISVFSRVKVIYAGSMLEGLERKDHFQEFIREDDDSVEGLVVQLHNLAYRVSSVALWAHKHYFSTEENEEKPPYPFVDETIEYLQETKDVVNELYEILFEPD